MDEPLDRLLTRAGAAAARLRQRAAAPHGLPAAALDALVALARTDSLGHRELAAELAISPASLTPVVDALEAAGAVRRERDPGDRRIVRVWITEAGRTVAGASRSADTLPPPPDELALRRWLYQVVATARGDW